MSGINWDVELKKIEREFSSLPPEPSAEAARAKRAAERAAQDRQDAKRGAIGAWVRLVLVVALGIGLWFWPYAHQCGAGLYGYLGAQAVILAGSLWVFGVTWRWHMPRTHALALLMVVAALALIASEVLPRVGYAKTDAAHPAQWRCAG